MTDFKTHTIESAPDGSKPVLEKAGKAMGFIPNLYGLLAESPATLEAYATLGGLFDSSSFNRTERQVVLLTASFENECGYCMAAHSTIAGMQRLPDEVVQALRDGVPLPDARLEALRDFTRRVVRERGRVSEADVRAFLDAGFERAQVLEVLLGVGMKTISNYANHVAKVPVDPAFQANAWVPPGGLSAAG